MADTVVGMKNAPGAAEGEKRYTEEDIARLEAGDLTDRTVRSKLRTAYYQNDTSAERERLVIERDLNVFVPETRLREMLDDIERIRNPSARKRADRLRILSRLAMLRKDADEEAAAQHDVA